MPNESQITEFIDVPELLARVEDDRELLTELLVMFRDELPELQNALHHSIDVGDLAQAAKVAHTLKGMSANMSLKKGTTLITEIEAAAKSGETAVLTERLVALDSEIAALSAAIDALTVGT